MTTNTAFIRWHRVLTYYLLTFAISWGGMFLFLAGRTGILATPEQAARLRPPVALITVAGPTVASLLLTGLFGGCAGYRQLFSRLLRWRVGARWYAVALLAGPLLVIVPLFVLLPTSPVFLPGILATSDKVPVLLVSLAAGLAGPVFEELGWTGFAIPRLRRQYGILTTGLFVGVLWGVWHVPSQVWYSGDASGALSWGILLPELVFALAVLPAYRALMLWVYDRTDGSLLLAILIHASLLVSLLAVTPEGMSGAPFLIWYLAVAVAAWIVVAAVDLATGGQFSRPRPKEDPVAKETPETPSLISRSAA